MTTFSPESRAVLKTSMGDITIAFLVDKAPRTCEHFARLARQGFYDGLTFHRVIKDFIVQGGCPRGDGSGGPGFTLRAEFNDTPHGRGVVSMARGTDPHSAGSQFFIVQAEARYLDSRYTAFAKVVEGLDVVDKIASVPVGENRFRELSTPRDPVFINRIVLEGVEFDANDLAAATPSATAGGAGGATSGEGPGAAPPMGSPPAGSGEHPGEGGDEGEDAEDDEGDAETDADEARGEAGHGVPDAGGGAEGESEHGEGERGDAESAGEGEGEGSEAPAPRAAGKTRSEGGGKNGGNGARRGGRRRRGRRGRGSAGGGGAGGGGGGGGGGGAGG